MRSVPEPRILMPEPAVKPRNLPLSVNVLPEKLLLGNYRVVSAPGSVEPGQPITIVVAAPLTSVDFHWYLDTRHGADY